MSERMFDLTTPTGHTERVSVRDMPELHRVLMARHWRPLARTVLDAWNTGVGKSQEGTVKEVGK